MEGSPATKGLLTQKRSNDSWALSVIWAHILWPLAILGLICHKHVNLLRTWWKAAPIKIHLSSILHIIKYRTEKSTRGGDDRERNKARSSQARHIFLDHQVRTLGRKRSCPSFPEKVSNIRKRFQLLERQVPGYSYKMTAEWDTTSFLSY